LVKGRRKQGTVKVMGSLEKTFMERVKVINAREGARKEGAEARGGRRVSGGGIRAQSVKSGEQTDLQKKGTF